jgi:hypothetical protein
VQFTRQKADSCLIVSWDWGALTAAILGEAIAGQFWVFAFPDLLKKINLRWQSESKKKGCINS